MDTVPRRRRTGSGLNLLINGCTLPSLEYQPHWNDRLVLVGSSECFDLDVATVLLLLCLPYVCTGAFSRLFHHICRQTFVFHAYTLLVLTYGTGFHFDESNFVAKKRTMKSVNHEGARFL